MSYTCTSPLLFFFHTLKTKTAKNSRGGPGAAEVAAEAPESAADATVVDDDDLYEVSEEEDKENDPVMEVRDVE